MDTLISVRPYLTTFDLVRLKILDYFILFGCCFYMYYTPIKKEIEANKLLVLVNSDFSILVVNSKEYGYTSTPPLSSRRSRNFNLLKFTGHFLKYIKYAQHLNLTKSNYLLSTRLSRVSTDTLDILHDIKEKNCYAN